MITAKEIEGQIHPHGMDLRVQQCETVEINGELISTAESDRTFFKGHIEGLMVSGERVQANVTFGLPKIEADGFYNIGGQDRMILRYGLADFNTPLGRPLQYHFVNWKQIVLRGLLGVFNRAFADLYMVGQALTNKDLQMQIDTWFKTDKTTQDVPSSRAGRYDLSQTVYMVHPQDKMLEPVYRRFPNIYRDVLDPASTPASRRINEVYRMTEGSRIVDGEIVRGSNDRRYCWTIEKNHMPVCLTPRRTHIARSLYVHAMDVVKWQKARIQPGVLHGLHAVTAVMNMPAYSGEDAIVVSESFSKKATAYREVTERYFLEGPFTVVVKEGEVIKPGDEIVFVRTAEGIEQWTRSLEEREKNGEDVQLEREVGYQGKAKRARKIHWPSTIKEIKIAPSNYMGRTLMRLSIKTVAEVPLEDGDKIATRQGVKGIVRVLPDSEMPETEEGLKIDLILSPDGIVKRRAMGVLWEMMANSYVKKTGQPVHMSHEAPRPTFKELVEMKFGQKKQLVLKGRNLEHMTFIGALYVIRIKKLAREQVSAAGERRRFTGMGIPVNDAKSSGQKINLRKAIVMVARGMPHVLKEIINEGNSGAHALGEIQKVLRTR